LEQPARASLRKYGVRFGAYHVYLPILLKPAPRTLAAQLWATRHEGLQSKGLDDLLHLARSGRTSMPINREIDPALYRTAGYRVCGERAVRVDILERLADLIRPALSWREGSGPKPPGAVAGGGFTVVNGMTSLTGASGEDFASILRSLGYRMERRPKPPEPVAEPVAKQPIAEPQPVAALAEAVVAADDTAVQIIPAAANAPVAAEPDAGDQAPAEETMESLAGTPALEGPIAAPIEDAEYILQPSPDEVAGSLAKATAVAAAGGETVQQSEPDMIEVWRPGRVHDGRRTRQKGRERRHQPRHRVSPPSRIEEAPAVPVAAAETAGGSAAEPIQPIGVAPSKEARPPRHRRRHAGEHRPDRPQRDRDRPPVKRFERREKAPDPNSPFAKLAALKAQLEADAKERR